MPHSKRSCVIIPRTWAVRGTTDISIDAEMGEA
jgi:hypothetical protein